MSQKYIYYMIRILIRWFRDHEIIVDKENNTTEISAGFDCEIINFESEYFRF